MTKEQNQLIEQLLVSFKATSENLGDDDAVIIMASQKIPDASKSKMTFFMVERHGALVGAISGAMHENKNFKEVVDHAQQYYDMYAAVSDDPFLQQLMDLVGKSPSFREYLKTHK